MPKPADMKGSTHYMCIMYRKRCTDRKKRRRREEGSMIKERKRNRVWHMVPLIKIKGWLKRLRVKGETERDGQMKTERLAGRQIATEHK